MKTWILATAFACAPWMCVGQAAAHGDDAHQITLVMSAQFDKPEARLTVAPISIEGDYAVAGWLQGERGGRALLHKDKNQWSVSVCGGAGLTRADVLQTTGMRPDAALRLAKSLATAENALGADQRKRFDSFEGMLKIDAAQGHASHAQHGQHAEPAKK
jgi:hypothetical protein